MGRGIRDHDRRELITMRSDLGPQILQVDSTIRSGLDYHNL
jgi:hypothetical protein